MIMIRVICSVVIITIAVFSIKVSAQHTGSNEKEPIEFPARNLMAKKINIPDTTKLILSGVFISGTYTHNNILSPNYYTANMGFFCKKELAIEKATKIPLRFRIGSLGYCNQLEGK